MTEIRRVTENDAPGLLEVLGWLPIRSAVIETSPQGTTAVGSIVILQLARAARRRT